MVPDVWSPTVYLSEVGRRRQRDPSSHALAALVHLEKSEANIVRLMPDGKITTHRTVHIRQMTSRFARCGRMAFELRIRRSVAWVYTRPLHGAQD